MSDSKLTKLDAENEGIAFFSRVGGGIKCHYCCLYLFERMPPVNPTPDLLAVRAASTPRSVAINQLGR